MALVDVNTLDIGRLPQWLRDTLPNELDSGEVITYEDGSFHVTGCDETFKTANDAANAVPHVAKLDSTVTTVVRDKHVMSDEDGSVHAVFEPIENSENLTLTFVSNEVRDVEELIESFDDWVEFHNKNVHLIGKDFLTSWEWISRHPMFWVRPFEDKVMWEDNNGNDAVRINVYRHESSDLPNILLEAGEHIAPDYKRHYVDEDLILHRNTFEEAVTALAARILELFNIDGTKISEMKKSE